MPSGRGDTDVDFWFVDPASSLKSVDKCFSRKDFLRFRREDQKPLEFGERQRNSFTAERHFVLVGIYHESVVLDADT